MKKNETLKLFILKVSENIMLDLIQACSKDGESYKHTMSYDFYDCDFTCYKLIIKDVSKWRAEKINEILNENWLW